MRCERLIALLLDYKASNNAAGFELYDSVGRLIDCVLYNPDKKYIVIGNEAAMNKSRRLEKMYRG